MWDPLINSFAKSTRYSRETVSQWRSCMLFPKGKGQGSWAGEISNAHHLSICHLTHFWTTYIICLLIPLCNQNSRVVGKLCVVESPVWGWLAYYAARLPSGSVFQCVDSPVLAISGTIQLAEAVSIRLTQTSLPQHTRDAKTWMIVIAQRVITSPLRLWMGQDVGWSEA